MSLTDSISENAVSIFVISIILIVGFIVGWYFMYSVTNIDNNSYDLEYTSEGILIKQVEGVEYNKLKLNVEYSDGFVRNKDISLSGEGDTRLYQFENNRTKYSVEDVELVAILTDSRVTVAELNEIISDIEFSVSNKSITQGEALIINGSDVVSNTDYVMKYTWEFDDVKLHSDSIAKTINDNQTVTLRVKDKRGMTHKTKFDVVVESNEELVSKSSLQVLSKEEFSLTSEFSNGSISSIVWDLDDGRVESGESVTHSYDSGGLYTVKMTATGTDGVEITDEINVHVLDSIDSDLYVENSSGFEFEFGSSVADAVTYEWMFGNDEKIVTEKPSVSYSYPSPGDYVVRLKTTNSDGLSSTSQINVTSKVNVVSRNETPFRIVSVSGDYEKNLMPTSEIGEEWPELSFTDGVRYRFTNLPKEIEFIDESENVVLSQKSNAKYNSNPNVNWVDNGSTVEFTVTESLGEELYGYIMEVE